MGPGSSCRAVIPFAPIQVYASEKSRHYARDTLHHLERTWAKKQLRLVNFILNVPYQEPQPERFRRLGSGRQRPAKLEYISKDSGTYVLSGESSTEGRNRPGLFGKPLGESLSRGSPCGCFTGPALLCSALLCLWWGSHPSRKLKQLFHFGIGSS